MNMHHLHAPMSTDNQGRRGEWEMEDSVNYTRSLPCPTAVLFGRETLLVFGSGGNVVTLLLKRKSC